MIELEGIRYSYPDTQGLPVLDGLDLKVNEGEIVLVAGASGSGKSTLALVLGGLIPHFMGGRLQGKATIDDIDLALNSPSRLLPHVGLVTQNADAQLFNRTVEQELAFGLESLGLPEEEISSRIRETSEGFGLGHLLYRSPADLSGGEKRLVSVAAMACMPSRTLLLDEPLAHLDEVSLEMVKRAFRRLRSEGRTLLVMEHRVQPLLDEVDRCVIMEQGRISFDGGPADAREELSRRGLIPTYARRFPADVSHRPAVLEVKDLHSRLGGQEVLKGVSFRLHEGETLAILGPNGAGKTTLIRHLNGLLRPEQGQVLLRGEPLARRDPSDLATEVGIVFQNPNDQFFCLTVREEILAGSISRKAASSGRLPEVCRSLGLSDLLDRSPYRLSEGEKRRVAMASVLAMGSRILVLDEPTAGQDGRSRMELARLMARLQADGMSVLIVTHDRAFAQAVADRCLEIEEGRIRQDEPSQRKLAGCGT
ncbi:MAG: ABC transporter ATP-binding protein [Thermodesulfobacteriota bacterium]